MDNKILRDKLGRRVREIWISWAKEQKKPKPSWLVPYDELNDIDKEVDQRIGITIWNDCIAYYQEYIAKSLMNKFKYED